jgi:poly(3-hydroxybutyrate) depolymerase
MATRRRTPLVAAALALLAAGSGAALAKGGKAAAKPPEWTEEGGTQVLRVFEPSEMKAYVKAPAEPAAGKKPELWVCLHGHGGTATGLFSYGQSASEGRGAVVLACEGSGTIATDRGEGHTWNPDRDAEAILACVEATVEKHGADPKRVVLLGLSAGGTMSLVTLGKKPSAFAGAVTCAAPMTPTGQHKGARVAVVLGTKDGNYGGFPAARQAAEKTVVGRVVSVTDLPHELPDASYARECAAWVLDSKAPSETLWVPQKPDDPALAPPEPPSKAKGGAFRHVLLFEAGGRGAPENAPARAAAKAAAAALLSEWRKVPPADLAAAIAAKSEDPLSKDAGGRVTGAVLLRYGGALSLGMAKAKAGEWAGPFLSDAGWHLIARDP